MSVEQYPGAVHSVAFFSDSVADPKLFLHCMSFEFNQQKCFEASNSSVLTPFFLTSVLWVSLFLPGAAPPSGDVPSPKVLASPISVVAACLFRCQFMGVMTVRVVSSRLLLGICGAKKGIKMLLNDQDLIWITFAYIVPVVCVIIVGVISR